MAPKDPPRWISQLGAFLQDSPPGDETWSRIPNANNSTDFAMARDINADLSDSDKYLALFAGALERSISPHDRRPQYADSLGLHTRVDA